MKKIAVMMMVAVIGVTTVACSSTGGSTAVGNTTQEATNANGEIAEEEMTPEQKEEVVRQHNAGVVLAMVVDAIKTAYGNQYLPDTEIMDLDLEPVYGLTEEMYQEVFIEVPENQAHSDILLAVKVAEGKQEEVVAALNTYRETLMSDENQYPLNHKKLQSSRVIERDGFVFFVSLGVLSGDVDGDDGIVKRAAELNDIAEEAIDSVLQ